MEGLFPTITVNVNSFLENFSFRKDLHTCEFLRSCVLVCHPPPPQLVFCMYDRLY